MEIPLGLHARRHTGYVALVDDDDYTLVSQHAWRAQMRRDGRLYALRGWWQDGKWHGQLMHNLIMGTVGIDHNDHNGLNNQRYNLRVATNRQNQGNTLLRTGCSSQYKGVTWRARDGRWQARLGQHSLGMFASETDAALAYNSAASEMFGEFAYLNLVPRP